jgi:16S rRNA (adenine1518-N6/adenine1519-N6)-dimethyltransferase
MVKKSRFAQKSLGQNFLVDTTVRDGILDLAGELNGKKVLEIGPGLGFLTTKLLAAGAELTAVEFDPRSVRILQSDFGHKKNFYLQEGDILQRDLDQLFRSNRYQVIANIPYHITTPIFRKLLIQTKNQPQRCILMVQKEVGQKICPQKRGSDVTEKKSSSGVFYQSVRGFRRSVISISVEIFAQAFYEFMVPRQSFDPVPGVDSAIIRFETRSKPLVPAYRQADFFTVVQAGFSEKRKKIGNVLGKFFGISTQALLGDIDPDQRAEVLSIEQWDQITQNFQRHK